MNTLKIGILGAASIARKGLIPAIGKLQDCRLIAVASRSEKKAKSFADQYQCEGIHGYDNLLDRKDINAVYIPLPNSMHEYWAVKSLEKGKHVLVEKPAALSETGARTMVELAKSKNLVIMEHFQFQYHRQFNFIKECIKSGEIGEIRNLRASFGYPPLNLPDIRLESKLGGGALYDAGCYTIKIASLILNHDFVIGDARMIFDQGRSPDIFGSATLSNQSGVSAQLAWGMDNYYQCQLEIWGSKGKLSTDRIFTAPPDLKPIIRLEKNSGIEAVRIDCDDHFVNILSEFKSCIKENRNRQHQYALMTQAQLLQQVRELAIHNTKYQNTG